MERREGRRGGEEREGGVSRVREETGDRGEEMRREGKREGK